MSCFTRSFFSRLFKGKGRKREATSDAVLDARDADSILTIRTAGSSWDDLIHVNVKLPNEMKIMIPIAGTAHVAQIRQEALRRAHALNVQMGPSETALYTTGDNQAIVFDGDLVEDVLGATEAITFALKSVEEEKLGVPSNDEPPLSLSPDEATEKPNQPDSLCAFSPPKVLSYPKKKKINRKVYIRWILAGDAMDYTELREIPPDFTSIDGSTTFPELRSIAMTRLLTSSLISPISVSPDSYTDGICADLYLSNCHLSLSSDNCVAIADIGLEGGPRRPLNIFVNFVNEGAAPRSDGVPSAWPFKCSPSGAATFLTCMEVLLHRLRGDRGLLNNFQAVLWEVTHFPPALIALEELCSHRTLIHDTSRPLAVFASCFRELCLRVVPSAVHTSSGTVLEGSRQVMAWLYSRRAETFTSYTNVPRLVREVELVEIRDDVPPVSAFEQTMVVEIPESGATAIDPPTQVRVGGYPQDLAPALTLATALKGEYAAPWNFHFACPSGRAGMLTHECLLVPKSLNFDHMVQIANQSGSFRMVEPLQLSQCMSSDLPVITLSSKGTVSTYDQTDKECGERYFYIWNAVEGQELLAMDGGQKIIQDMNSNIEEWKKERSWKVKGWADEKAKVDTRPAGEAIVICVDRSASMNSAMGTSWTTDEADGKSLPHTSDRLSRLTEVKQIFKDLVSRVAASNLPTHLGLVTFSDGKNVKVEQEITPVLLNFQDRLEMVHPSGNTAMWNGLDQAKNMLIRFGKEYPTARRRIILLTDGEDNSSFKHLTPYLLCDGLWRNNIVLDAVVIGSERTQDLFRIAKHTGGYAFAPRTRDLMFQMATLETFTDIKTRPDASRPPPPAVHSWESSKPKQADMQTLTAIPPMRSHPNQDDYCIPLRDADRFLTMSLRRGTVAKSKSGIASSRSSTLGGTITSSSSTAASGSTLGATGSGGILLGEIRATLEQLTDMDYVDIYVSESNMGFWKVVMQGPPETPYSNGVYLLYIDIGTEFPRKPPTVRFITPIMHPNVNKHGRICHAIFNREWTPATRLHQVLQHIWGMLMTLEVRDAVDPLFTFKYYTDPEKYREEIEKHVSIFAWRSREQWRGRISDSTSSSGDQDPRPTDDSAPFAPTAQAQGNTPSMATTLSTRLATLRSSRGSANTPTTPLNQQMYGGPDPAETSETSAPNRQRTSIFGNLGVLQKK